MPSPVMGGGSAATLASLGVTATAAELNALAGVKRYVALLSQVGTDAPVATVLENTLGGAVVWTRDDVGSYYGALAGAFPPAKTGSRISGPRNAGAMGTHGVVDVYTSNDTNLIVVSTHDVDGASAIDVSSDEVLSRTFLEVIVYP